MDFVTYTGFSPADIFLLVILVILLFLSAMISSSEVAFFSLGNNELRQAKEMNSLSSECLGRLLERSESLLATILVVNNLVNICIVIISAKIIDSVFIFERFEFLFTGVLVTFILLLFGEILPKVFAQDSTLRVALMFSVPLFLLRYIFYPVSYIIMHTSSKFENMTPHNKADLTIEDLADVVDNTQATSTQERKILSGIVNFASTEVDEIMRPRREIEALENTMTFEQVKSVIIESGYSRLPVYEEDLDNIIGTLFVKDILAHISRGNDFMWQKAIRPPYFVPLHKKINSILEDFQRDKVHMAIVVDEYGATHGLVSLEDILEEVVGEISDESDEEETFYRRLNENTYIFEAQTHIVDMLRVLRLDADLLDDVQGRAETIAGLLLEIKRNFLKKDDEVASHGLRFIVMNVDGHRIDKVKIIVSNAK